jgi:hypothetical protein
MSATLVFAIFAFGFIGLMLVGAFILDRRRVKDVHEAIPERSEGAFDPDQRTDGSPTGPIDNRGTSLDPGGDTFGRTLHGRVHDEPVERPAEPVEPADRSASDARRRGQ